MDWLKELNACKKNCESAVIITIVETQGSTPRPAGTKMLVSTKTQQGTIGGGHLEYKAVLKAKALLEKKSQTPLLEHYSLSASFGQCCGGKITLLFEPLLSQSHDLWVFGAGHVGQSIVRMAAEMPINIYWVDSRKEQFFEPLPENTSTILTDDPALELKAASLNSACVILTHSHQLDFEILKQALEMSALSKQNWGYLGVIGSDTKRKSFLHKLKRFEFKKSIIEQLHCPVGTCKVAGKEPSLIALSLLAELLEEWLSKEMDLKVDDSKLNKNLQHFTSIVSNTELNNQGNSQ